LIVSGTDVTKVLPFFLLKKTTLCLLPSDSDAEISVSVRAEK
ncbi:MAG: hypothetical protein ACI9GE_001017, partial [Oceanospirillaceae bacterium]